MFKPAKEMKVTAATIYEQSIEKDVAEMRPKVATAIETAAGHGFFHVSVDYAISGYAHAAAKILKNELVEQGYDVSLQCGSLCIGWDT